jgi:hypothetical protein
LGRDGIHGVGIRSSEKALCIYLDPGSRLAETQTLREIEDEAAPFKILLIEEEPPTISPPSAKKGGLQGSHNRADG